MNDSKPAILSVFNSLMEYWKVSGRAVRSRIIASVLFIVFSIIFCFNLFSFSKDAAYSDDRIKKDRSAVENYDYQDVKTVESLIKTLEEKDTVKINNKAMSNVYYLKKFRDSVILGDSITEGLTVYGFLPDDIVLCSIGASLAGSKPLFKKAAKLVPDSAFFTFGMNDMITYRGKVKPFIKQYSSLLDSFHRKSPDTVIYINSVSPPDKGAQKKQPSLKSWKKYNEALKKLCDEKDYTFIDNTYILQKKPKLYQPDGIHVVPEYYPLWMNDMIMEAGL